MEQTDITQHIVGKSKRLVNIKGLTAHFGGTVPESWLRKLAADGTLPCLRMGSKTVYSIDDVEAKLVELASQPSPRATKKRGPRKAKHDATAAA